MTEPKAPAVHQHHWRMHSHIDGCHFFQTAFVCGCGEVHYDSGERNFHDPDDPYSMVFAVDDCPRCQELLKGAAPNASEATP
jgi:hypothetical protein